MMFSRLTRVDCISALVLLIYGSLGVLLADDQVAPLREHRLRYERHGTGPRVVVLIHGWSCNATFWRLQIPAFVNAGWRVIAVDLPGHEQCARRELYAGAVRGRCQGRPRARADSRPGDRGA
jgi:alpha-beta hydrolase superfamily lysophospholipase